MLWCSSARWFMQLSSFVIILFVLQLMWMNGGGSSTPAHKDGIENILCVLRGDKLVTLVDPVVHGRNASAFFLYICRSKGRQTLHIASVQQSVFLFVRLSVPTFFNVTPLCHWTEIYKAYLQYLSNSAVLHMNWYLHPKSWLFVTFYLTMF